ncbi:MAG: AI-2E family transporter [Firmicutes bacterium]|nr:AI-2E family transporter [Bacillota bacterium]
MPKKILWGLVIIGLSLFLYRVRSILTPFLFAIVIAYLLYPLIISFENRGVPKTAAIILVYTLFGVFLGVILWLFIPRLARELDELLKKLPAQTEQWEGFGQNTVSYLRQIKLPGTIEDALKIIMERMELALENLAGGAAQTLLDGLAHLVFLLLSPILAFYFLRDHQRLRERSLQYIPASSRGEVLIILRDINQALHGFFRGQILVSFSVGLLIYGGLAVLGLRYALFIGFIAGLFDLIPYLGPILGFIPAAVLAFLKSPLTVLWVLLLFLAANQLESNIIAPKIIGDRVGLHPLVIIFAVLVGGHVMGIAGMLLAVPLAAVLRVLLQYFFKRKLSAP